MTSKHGFVENAATQKRNTVCREAVEGNALSRAASTNETAAQRIARQESVVAIQIQLTDEALRRVTNGGSHASHSDRCQPESLATSGVLQGVGSQFGDSSDPSSDSRHQGDLVSAIIHASLSWLTFLRPELDDEVQRQYRVDIVTLVYDLGVCRAAGRSRIQMRLAPHIKSSAKFRWLGDFNFMQFIFGLCG